MGPKLLDDLAHQLWINWGLEISKDSKRYTLCKGHPDSGVVADDWTNTTNFEGLGHIISHDASTSACWENTRDKMWSDFWANSAAVINAKNCSGKLGAESQRIANFA